MEQMLRYIFGELQGYKACVTQVVKKQASFNRSVAFFAMTTLALGVIHHIQIHSQEEKIKLLYREIKRLKESDDYDWVYSENDKKTVDTE